MATKTLDTLTVQMVDGKLVMSAVYVAVVTDPFTGETSTVRSSPMPLTDDNASEFEAALGDITVAASARAEVAEQALGVQTERANAAEARVSGLSIQLDNIKSQNAVAVDEANVRYSSLQALLNSSTQSEAQLRSENAALRVENAALRDGEIGTQSNTADEA